MKAIEIITAKLLKDYKESFKIFEDSCKYSIEHSLDYVKGVLLYREKKIEYCDMESVHTQLLEYLKTQGYEHVIVKYKDTFHTERGFEHGSVFIVFLTFAAVQKYLKESEQYEKDYAQRAWSDKELKRPFYDEIKYLNIYEKKKKQ